MVLKLAQTKFYGKHWFSLDVNESNVNSNLLLWPGLARLTGLIPLQATFEPVR